METWDEDIVLLEIDNTEGTRTQYTQGPGEWGMLVSQQVNTTVTYLGSDDRNNVRLLLPQAGIGTSAGYKAFGSVLPTPGTPATPFQYGGNVGYYAESPTAGLDETEFYRTLHRIYRFHRHLYELCSSRSLVRLTKDKVPRTLAEWFRVLRPGGHPAVCALDL